MTQEEKFKEAKRLYETANADQRYVLESLFPELKEPNDERIRKEIISAIKEDWPGHTDWIAWLERQEQKPAWSEEDEKFFKTALWHISYSVSNGKSTDIHCDTTDWLKDLKDRVQPQSRWKPSDEQIRILELAIDYWKPNDVSVTTPLYNLLEQLKKLREE